METRPLEWIAPRVFAGVGLLLLMLACYMAGADSLACGRSGDRVDCRVARSRLLGFVTVEQFDVPDVIDAWVQTSSNDTLILHTRDNRDIATLGGDHSASYADQVVAIVKTTGAAPAAANPGRTEVSVKDELTSFEVQDSYIPIALVCGGLGAVFVIFGLVAMRRP